MPAATTWAREILQANANLGSMAEASKTIEERNSRSLELMEASNIPKFDWVIDPFNGDIIVQAESPPTAVHVWQATTYWNNRRDFRIANLDDPCLCGIGGISIGGYDNLCANLFVFWTAQELNETSPGSLTWIAHRDPPSLGRWTAFFVDMQFDGPKYDHQKSHIVRGWPVGEDGVFDFTTEVSIVPNTFPYPECHAEECFGTIV